jgi:hypothetical protein
MLVSSSLSIEHVQVAQIKKNTMTIDILISGESLGQKKNCRNNNITGHWSRRKIHQSEFCPKPENWDKEIEIPHQGLQCGWNPKQMRNYNEIHPTGLDN